jgi:dTDP-4-dehydrorhamnose reductase
MPTKARRPEFSALESIRLPKYNIKIREWKEALNEYLIEKGHIRHSL